MAAVLIADPSPKFQRYVSAWPSGSEEFEPVAKADDASDVAYVGEFRRIKGADLLIEAVARLRAGGKPVTLTLGGDGEEFERLKEQVKRLSLGPIDQATLARIPELK